MDWFAAASDWNRFKGIVGARWKRLTASQLDLVSGHRAQLGEQICLSYGLAPAQAELQLRRFETDIDDRETLTSRR